MHIGNITICYDTMYDNGVGSRKDVSLVWLTMENPQIQKAIREAIETFEQKHEEFNKKQAMEMVEESEGE